jgi:hypothetical protein
VFTGCNAELGAFILSADDFTELLPASKAQMLHKKSVSNVRQDMERRPWILDNARSFADAVIFAGKKYSPYNDWANSSCSPCPLVRFHAHSASCLWIGDALILSDDCSLHQSVELSAGARVVCTCDIGEIACPISLSDACWMSISEMFEAHCCMADSQFAPVESLSVLRLLEPSDVCHKVAEVAAWLNGAVWRVRPQLCACFSFRNCLLTRIRSNLAVWLPLTLARLCCMPSSFLHQAPLGNQALSKSVKCVIVLSVSRRLSGGAQWPVGDISKSIISSISSSSTPSAQATWMQAMDDHHRQQQQQQQQQQQLLLLCTKYSKNEECNKKFVQ